MIDVPAAVRLSASECCASTSWCREHLDDTWLYVAYYTSNTLLVDSYDHVLQSYGRNETVF